MDRNLIYPVKAQLSLLLIYRSSYMLQITFYINGINSITFIKVLIFYSNFISLLKLFFGSTSHGGKLGDSDDRRKCHQRVHLELHGREKEFGN